jgi:hypothetical protein
MRPPPTAALCCLAIGLKKSIPHHLALHILRQLWFPPRPPISIKLALSIPKVSPHRNNLPCPITQVLCYNHLRAVLGRRLHALFK